MLPSPTGCLSAYLIFSSLIPTPFRRLLEVALACSQLIALLLLYNFPVSLDENIYELRKQKLQQIEALGQPAYPHKFSVSHQVPQILAEYAASTGEQLESGRVNVTVAGRLVAIRLMGKASFAHLQQSGERLQVYVKKDAVGDQLWNLYKLLDIGDHVGVAGYLFRTRTGELSIHVEKLTFLAKDLLPLPEKFHGLTDVELRYRMRYVDLIDPEVRQVSPSVPASCNRSAAFWIPAALSKLRLR